MTTPPISRAAPADALSATFAALSDPTRRAILARLGRGEATVAQLAAPFAISAPAVTKHLKVLLRAGLVVQGRQRQWRPCRLRVQPLQEVAEWVAQCQTQWEQRLDPREDRLSDGAGPPPPPSPPPARRLRPAPSPGR